MPCVDVLVLAPHPDDAEIYCGGLLLKAKRAGFSIGVIDVTQGEMGTRGTRHTRKKEAAAASRFLKLDVRENCGMPDGGLCDDGKLRSLLVARMRKYRPGVVLAPHWEDQHPDHAALGQAAIHAAYLAGVPKFAPRSARGIASPGRLPYRPRQILHYNNRYGIKADVVVDVSDVYSEKVEAIRCFESQFGAAPLRHGHDAEPQTRLSNEKFFEWFRGIHLFYGFQAGVEYGEAYCVKNPVCVGNVDLLLGKW